MPHRKRHKRSRMFVDADVQGGVLRKIALHWAIFFLCNALALMIWIRLFEQPDARWGETLGDTLRRFLPFFVITTALIPAFVWDTLKLTNRFAGPIMRLRSTLSDFNAGRNVTPLRFREGDYWQEIAANFNQVLARYVELQSRSSDPPQENRQDA